MRITVVEESYICGQIGLELTKPAFRHSVRYQKENNYITTSTTTQFDNPILVRNS